MEKVVKNAELDIRKAGSSALNGKGSDLLELTAQVVSNHLSNNSVEATDIPALIREVRATMLSALPDAKGEESADPSRQEKPATPDGES